MRGETTERKYLEVEARREDALGAVTAGISSAATRDEVLRVIVDEGGRALAASAAVAYALDQDGATLILVAHRGVGDALADLEGGVLLASHRPVARGMREGHPLWITSREMLARDFPDFERAAGGAFKCQAVVALPLRARGQITAGIGFAFAEARSFDDGERELLTTLCARCEAALGRALLYEDSQAARATAERDLATAAEALRFNEVVAGVLAHDLKNPLAAVLMNARLLSHVEGERERKVGARIVASGERMARMIDQILDWTRVRAQAGRVQIVRAECDLGAIAERAVTELKAHKAEAQITLERRGRLNGRWDADRMSQVVSNLVGNGIDHASRPGVAVSLEGAGDVVRLTGENQGQIDDELLPVIFEPFRGRASGGRVRARGRGLGVGLYIARQIVAAHGGSLDVARPSGERVVFTATLPRGLAA